MSFCSYSILWLAHGKASGLKKPPPKFSLQRFAFIAGWDRNVKLDSVSFAQQPSTLVKACRKSCRHLLNGHFDFIPFINHWFTPDATHVSSSTPADSNRNQNYNLCLSSFHWYYFSSVVWNCLPHGLIDNKSGLSLALRHGFLEHNYSGTCENVVEVTLRKSVF